MVATVVVRVEVTEVVSVVGQVEVTEGAWVEATEEV